MGWYDAYTKYNPNSQALNMIGSDKGTYLSSFGDAFSDIGKNINKYEDVKQKDELIKKRNAFTDLQLENEATKITNMFEKTQQQNQQRNQKKVDDAFKKDLLTIDGTQAKQALIDYANSNEDKFYGDNGVSFDALQYGKNLIKQEDKTVAAIKNETAKLKQQQHELQWQDKLNKANKKVSKKDDSFKYTEATGAKIKSLLATSMGMDAPNFNMDDAVKKQYEQDVAGVSAISKTYSLEPNLALDVYRNPDKYIINIKTKKIYTNPEYSQEKHEKDTPKNNDELWKKYR